MPLYDYSGKNIFHVVNCLPCSESSKVIGLKTSDALVIHCVLHICNTLCPKRTAPFYFCNNFVKLSFFNNFWHAYTLINFLSHAYFTFFVNQKTEYQLKICFCLLVSRRTAMVLNNEDIKNKRLQFVGDTV